MRSRISLAVAATLAVILGVTVLGGAVFGRGGGGRYVVGSDDDTTTPFNLVSVPALIAHRYDGHGLRLDTLQASNRVRNRWQISYTGDGLRLGGTLLVPRTPGRHPLVVALHGYVPPPAYGNGAGLRREEERLVERGFAVLHPDYRNFGASERDLVSAVASPLGYPADVLNAVVALRHAHLPGIDMNRMALLGRSMGGGVAMQVAVARPSWFQGLVLYSPVSSEAAYNYDNWVVRDASLRHRVDIAHGTPETNPVFWHDASVANYLGRLTMPVRINHGLADKVCPERWSVQTTAAMRAAGVDVRLDTYRGQPHRFTNAAWPTFMDRVDSFFEERLGPS